MTGGSFVVVISALIALQAPAPTWRELADRDLRAPVYGCANVMEQQVSGLDADGYGDTAWSLSYAMEALDVMYEGTDDPAYLAGACRVAHSLLDARDRRLAEQSGAAGFTDFARGRVMNAWGTGHYSAGQHTCHLVHQGMLLYPIAELARIVRSGGKRTERFRAETAGLADEVRAVMREFDSEWRDGPRPGMGYYVDPQGSVLPNNWQSAMGRVYLALGDSESRTRGAKIARYLRSKLTLVADGDYWVWAYSQRGPDGPAGTGEDISHAAINAHFLYLAWERHAGISRRDVERLTRTFTRGIHLGAGQMAGRLGTRTPGDAQFTEQCGRWAYLARFDRSIEQSIRAYMASHPTSGALAGPTGALGFAYLARAQRFTGRAPRR